MCIDRACSGADGGLRADAGPDASHLDAFVCPSASVCGTDCCTASQLCYGGTTCVHDSGACTTTASCPGDSYCDPSTMHCIPYGVPPGHDSDPSCTRLVAAGTFSPTVQCAFTAAPAGDPWPANLHVLSTPMVVDFGIGRTAGSPRRPSIVAVFDDGVDGGSEQPTGVIRILDGASCVQQAQLGSLQLVSHSSPPAVGDLDGDGRAEIVANQAGGGVVAFTYDSATSAWRVLWRSMTGASCTTPYNITGDGWAGPSLVDLDDDGLPEVLRGGIVIGHDGCVLDATSLGLHSYNYGIFGVVADVDADGHSEFVAGDGVWEWSTTTHAWSREAYAPATTTNGQVAIGDFGDFPGGHAWPSATPEVVVISAGAARVQTLDGMIVFGPVTLPGGGTGGAPTIGDFDGDHRPEFASAGASAYSVFDLDCVTSPAPIGTCATGTTNGVLWSQRSQDQSSNVTGSSIFDFEGDGRAEAVYGDECFVRVYDGRSGTVLFSQSRSSCTWYENPVVADVDGDFNAEIVIGDNWNCPTPGFTTGRDCTPFGLDARSTDPLFAGLRCAGDGECLSGHCDSGFCRCTTDAECCASAGCETFVCSAPPAGTPGTGNTCRASRPVGTLGIRVYRDGADRWVRSRMVWNQHAYFVSNTDEFGTIPRTSATMSNWLDPMLNNFRENVQGDATPGASPDLTTAGSPLTCDAMGARLTARICNRGTEPAGSGVTVGFYVGDPAMGGMRICDGSSVGDLAVGECENVQCAWPAAPTSAPGMDIWVVADDGSVVGECRESNNVTTFRGVYCGGPS